MGVEIRCSECGRKIVVPKEVFDWFKNTSNSKIVCNYCSRRKERNTKLSMLTKQEDNYV